MKKEKFVSVNEFLNRHIRLFTEGAVSAFKTAEEIAAGSGDAYVNSAYILYGLSREKNGAARELLAKYDITDVTILSGIVTNRGGASSSAEAEESGNREIVYSYGAAALVENVVAGALARSTEAHEGCIGSLHILYAIFCGDSMALRILGELGDRERPFFTELCEMLNSYEVMRRRLIFPISGMEVPEEINDDETRGYIEEFKRSQEAARRQEQFPPEMQQNMPQQPAQSALETFGTPLSAARAGNDAAGIIGRRDEMMRIIRILIRNNKNNPVLVGEAGVGKTAVVEGIADMIASGHAPDCVKNLKLIRLDMTAVVAGTRYRGDFEERMKQIIEEAAEDRNVVLFIDEIHTIIGSGGGEGGMDASNLLKPALSRGRIRIIGATTPVEYRKYFEKDAALSRRFQPVAISEPDDGETLQILEETARFLERFHGVSFENKALKAAVTLSRRYISDRFLPDKAIDVIDEAAAMVRTGNLSEEMNRTGGGKRSRADQREKSYKGVVRDMYEMKIRSIRDKDRGSAAWLDANEKIWKNMLEDQRENGFPDAGSEPVPPAGGQGSFSGLTVRVHDVERVVSMWSGVPVEKVGKTDSERLLGLEEILHRRVVGQDEAVNMVAKAVRRGRAGMKDPKRPTGSFLFLGPTGVGKTELARTLAESLFGSERNLIRLDMSEYMEAHSVSKMVGSPPGYIGHDDGGQLTDRVRSQPYSVILFDEIEKAHPDVYNVLLQVLEDGTLTDSKGRSADFRNCLIIMTSNIGARDITDRKHLGFTDDTEENRYQQISDAVTSELKKAFKPEFLNRIDETVIFRPLTMEQIEDIARIQLQRIAARGPENRVVIEFSDDVPAYIARRGYDPKFGARPLKRIIRRDIEDMLSEEILKRTLGGSGAEDGGEAAEMPVIRVVVKNDEIAFEAAGGT